MRSSHSLRLFGAAFRGPLTKRYVSLLAKEGAMKKAVLPLIALLAFTVYTAFTMSQTEQSLIDFGIELISNLDTAQVVIDLYILAVLACIWMYQDNKSRKKPFIAIVPYIVITTVLCLSAHCSTLSLKVSQMSKVPV